MSGRMAIPTARGGLGRLLRPLPWAVWATVPVLAVGLVVIGWVGAAELTFPITGSEVRHSPVGVVWPILGTNLAAAGLMFSGVATAGVSTVIMMPVTMIFLGSVIRATANAVGGSRAFDLFSPFLVFEFAGIVVAACCGVAPAVRAVQVLRSGDGAGPRRLLAAHLSGAADALRWTAVCAVLLVTGAVLEVYVGGIPR